MKQMKLNHAIWMLSNAIQRITEAQSAIERNDEPSAIGWLDGALESINDAQYAIDETNILPY